MEKALPYLRSPIREIWFTDNHLPEGIYKLTGNTALGEYTMLAETKQVSWLWVRRLLIILKLMAPLANCTRNLAKTNLKYNPLLLAQGKFVDRLSLYLSMRNETNERVQRVL